MSKVVFGFLFGAQNKTERKHLTVSLILIGKRQLPNNVHVALTIVKAMAITYKKKNTGQQFAILRSHLLYFYLLFSHNDPHSWDAV